MNVNVDQAYQNICAQLGGLEMEREELDKKITKVREALRALQLVMGLARCQPAPEPVPAAEESP